MASYRETELIRKKRTSATTQWALYEKNTHRSQKRRYVFSARLVAYRQQPMDAPPPPTWHAD